MTEKPAAKPAPLPQTGGAFVRLPDGTLARQGEEKPKPTKGN
jgi:hypothetical protein